MTDERREARRASRLAGKGEAKTVRIFNAWPAAHSSIICSANFRAIGILAIAGAEVITRGWSP